MTLPTSGRSRSSAYSTRRASGSSPPTPTRSWSRSGGAAGHDHDRRGAGGEDRRQLALRHAKNPRTARSLPRRLPRGHRPGADRPDLRMGRDARPRLGRHRHFEDLGDGRTKVITDSIFHTAEERDGMLESGMEAGMNETYDRLDELLAKRRGSGALDARGRPVAQPHRQAGEQVGDRRRQEDELAGGEDRRQQGEARRRRRRGSAAGRCSRARRRRRRGRRRRRRTPPIAASRRQPRSLARSRIAARARVRKAP